jgi:hypothetical protein
MTTNIIPGAAFFLDSETFLKDLSPEDELMITGGSGSGTDTTNANTSASSSKSAT